MERKKSLLAATIISATLLTGAVAYAASSGVLEGRDDNVGNLQPTTSQSRDITVFVDPVTGSVTTSPTTTAATGATPAPAAAVTAPATAPTTTRRVDAGGTPTTSTIDDQGGLRGDDDDDDNSGSGSNNSGSGSDDRLHGRGTDDD